MLVKHFFIEKIAHSSYLIGGKKTCAIVDPSRDTDRYIAAAEEEGLKITHILETHLHADFVSGHMDLADLTGADIYAPKNGNCEFEHIPVGESSAFSIEDMDFYVHDTPGHTPDCLLYVVSDRSRGNEPVAVFTGDTLFVGDVGRPDLFPGMAEELAGSLYDNLHNIVEKIPDHCIVYPAHGAGSLCGKSMGEMRISVVGYEKKFNPALLIEDKEEFIRSLTEDMPPAPDHFSRCSNINRKGPALMSSLPKLTPLNPAEFKESIDEGRSAVLDIRNYAGFGGQHIPGSYHIDVNSNFPTFAGWVIPPERDILFVGDNHRQAEDALVMLRRVGIDSPAGYLKGGTHAWAMSGYETDRIAQLSAYEVNEKINSDGTVLLDVRSPEEFSEGHIPGSVNVPAMDVRKKYNDFDPEKPVICMCRTGHRSSLACSLLKQRGFKEVYNAAGGFTGYLSAGFSV